MKRWLALAAAGVLGAGCGSNVLSCTATSMGANVSCVEIDNPPGGSRYQAQTDCANQHGTYADAPCPHAGLLGGCRLDLKGAPFTTTTWFYAFGTIKTAADVMTQCGNLGATFVAP